LLKKNLYLVVLPNMPPPEEPSGLLASGVGTSYSRKVCPLGETFEWVHPEDSSGLSRLSFEGAVKMAK
jgi:hypothetical protein